MPPKTHTKSEAPETIRPRGMTMAKVEEVYGITRRKQYILIDQGLLKSYKLLRTRYVDVDSIESAISGSQT
jgi:hypothetical protein